MFNNRYKIPIASIVVEGFDFDKRLAASVSYSHCQVRQSHAFFEDFPVRLVSKSKISICVNTAVSYMSRLHQIYRENCALFKIANEIGLRVFGILLEHLFSSLWETKFEFN